MSCDAFARGILRVYGTGNKLTFGGKLDARLGWWSTLPPHTHGMQSFISPACSGSRRSSWQYIYWHGPTISYGWGWDRLQRGNSLTKIDEYVKHPWPNKPRYRRLLKSTCIVLDVHFMLTFTVFVCLGMVFNRVCIIIRKWLVTEVIKSYFQVISLHSFDIVYSFI
jgi:hypothetical protein